jgi:hypothetical protein
VRGLLRAASVADSVVTSVVGTDVPGEPREESRAMHSYLNVITAEADSALRTRELLREIEQRRRTAGAAPAGRPSLAARLLATARRSSRAVFAH